jgi:hypothetical protein
MSSSEPLPALPYAGTSGWSGSPMSRGRAARRDADGSTLSLQTIALRLVGSKGPRGLTVAEARRLLPYDHHGSISGALSNLHKAGRIACLIDTRDHCHIYVLPGYVRDRATREQGRR